MNSKNHKAKSQATIIDLNSHLSQYSSLFYPVGSPDNLIKAHSSINHEPAQSPENVEIGAKRIHPVVLKRIIKGDGSIDPEKKEEFLNKVGAGSLENLIAKLAKLSKEEFGQLAKFTFLLTGNATGFLTTRMYLPYVLNGREILFSDLREIVKFIQEYKKADLYGISNITFQGEDVFRNEKLFLDFELYPNIENVLFQYKLYVLKVMAGDGTPWLKENGFLFPEFLRNFGENLVNGENVEEAVKVKDLARESDSDLMLAFLARELEKIPNLS